MLSVIHFLVCCAGSDILLVHYYYYYARYLLQFHQSTILADLRKLSYLAYRAPELTHAVTTVFCKIMEYNKLRCMTHPVTFSDSFTRSFLATAGIGDVNASPDAALSPAGVVIEAASTMDKLLAYTERCSSRDVAASVRLGVIGRG